MPTKKITDLTQLTDLDATDSFVVNDSGAGADKRVEFSDLQSEVLNGAAIGTSTAITELQVDNLNLNGNTFSSTDTNGNILIQPNGTGATVINESGAASDFRVEGDTEQNLLFVDASTDRVGIGTSSPTATLSVDGSAVFNESGADVDFRIEGDNDSDLLFVDASTDRVGISTNAPSTTFHVAGSTLLDGATTINDGSADVDFRVEGNTDTHLIFADAGNDRVGIGTSSPGASLDIQAGTYKTLRLGTKTITEGALPNTGITSGLYTYVFTFEFASNYGATLITLDISTGVVQNCFGRYTFAVECTAGSGAQTVVAGSPVTVFQHDLSSFAVASSGTTDRRFTVSVTRAGTIDFFGVANFTLEAMRANGVALNLISITAT